MKLFTKFSRQWLLLMTAMVLSAFPAQAQYVFATIDDPVAVANDGTTYVTGISGDLVVGYYYGPQVHGFYHTLGTTNYVTLDVPAGTSSTSSSTVANGVSGNSIVGYYDATNSSGRYGFIYNIATSNYTALVNMGVSDGNTVYIEALGVDGTNVVGNVIDLEPLVGTLQEGFLFTLTAEGDNDSLFYYPSPSQIVPDGSITLTNYTTRAYGISGPNIVGYWVDESEYSHGYVYNINTHNYTSVPGPGNQDSPLTGINGNNVVGNYADPSYSYNNSGFIYNLTTDTYTTSLHDPLAPGNSFLTGIYGSTIVGYYLDNEGSTHGFVATMPIPVLDLKVVGAKQIFTATNGVAGASCYLLDTTSLVLPVNQWSELSSNMFNASGVFFYTNQIIPNMPPTFYVLSKTP
jgi:hypothetical protein